MIHARNPSQMQDPKSNYSGILFQGHRNKTDGLKDMLL